MANHPNRGRRCACCTPQPEEVIGFQARAGLSNVQCADLVCVTEATWLRWRTGEREMPAGAWKLFRICVGELSPK